MRSDLGVLVVDECFCQLRTETILGSGVQQRQTYCVTWNLSSARIHVLPKSHVGRSTSTFQGCSIHKIKFDKGLTRSQCATSDVLSRDETATDLLARDARSQEAYEAANGMDVKLPSRIRLVPM
jgi:hypothetical protein